MRTLSIWMLRSGLLATAVAFASLSPAAQAQLKGKQYKVNVPFGFEYGSHHYAAGTYKLGMPLEHFMSIQSSSSSGAALTMPDLDGKAAPKSKVVFRRYGGQYFLREVWIAGESTHLHCVPTKQEVRAVRSLVAAADPAPTGLEVALLETQR